MQASIKIFLKVILHNKLAKKRMQRSFQMFYSTATLNEGQCIYWCPNADFRGLYHHCTKFKGNLSENV